jgi:DNA adenine methylase
VNSDRNVLSQLTLKDIMSTKKRKVCLSSMNDYLSPLRYPGAKRKIARHIKELLQMYDCTGNVFIEPCCGGASVSLYLLEHAIVSSVVLMDKDPWVASFWYMLFFETESLIKDIESVDVSVETWIAFRDKEPLTTREKALYCFFFNRTCYSGILNGGMIGGYKQNSEYKIDCRFNKPELLTRIKYLAGKFAGKVEVREASVFDVLDQAREENHSDRVYYIDPPYVKKGMRLYPHKFEREEHQKLRDSLTDLRIPWILSYHDHDLIHELYLNDSRLERLSLDVIWAHGAQPGRELLISNLQNVRARVPLPLLPPPLGLWTVLGETGNTVVNQVNLTEAVTRTTPI